LRQNSKPRAVIQCDSTKKFGCREALFAFELHFDELQPGVSGAGHQQTMVFNANLAGENGGGLS
jgi:hypothetical protein